ncbi:hypothetical protein [Brevundimonas sp.]|uniref:hypothetical protein n=1 Tax=Brevundimonas sp. TaxID=1871086 RepID=UPI003AF80C03
MIALVMAYLLGSAAGLPLHGPDPGTDWDYAVAEDNISSVASVGYSSGLVVNVTCYGGGTLNVVVTGLPSVEGDRYSVRLSRADGRTTSLPTATLASGTLSVDYDERMARIMRGGGELVMRLEDEQSPPVAVRIDLPEQHANLDRVIEHCDRRLDEPRDSLPILTDLRSIPRATFPPARRARTGSSEWARVEISCVVSAETRLEECQVEHQDGGSRAYGTAVTRAYDGTRVDVADPTAAAGKVVHVVVTGATVR